MHIEIPLWLSLLLHSKHYNHKLNILLNPPGGQVPVALTPVMIHAAIAKILQSTARLAPPYRCLTTLLKEMNT